MNSNKTWLLYTACDSKSENVGKNKFKILIGKIVHIALSMSSSRQLAEGIVSTANSTTRFGCCRIVQMFESHLFLFFLVHAVARPHSSRNEANAMRRKSACNVNMGEKGRRRSGEKTESKRDKARARQGARTSWKHSLIWFRCIRFIFIQIEKFPTRRTLAHVKWISILYWVVFFSFNAFCSFSLDSLCVCMEHEINGIENQKRRAESFCQKRE